MKEHIEKLEAELIALKRSYEKQQRKEYERQNHKTFKKGDWVKCGDKFGKVEWVENSAINITEDMGYCGIDLRSGSGGFAAKCKRDEWQLIEGDELKYLTDTHTLKLKLTGEELQELILRYKYGNQSDTTILFMEALENAGRRNSL